MVNQITIKPITADEVAQMEAQDIVREIVNGQWTGESKALVAGKLHGLIGGRVFGELFIFLKSHPELGEVYQDSVSYVLEGTKGNIINMRIPDCSFVTAARVDTSDPGYYYIAPDLAVEVISPSERETDIEEKVKDYLRFGTQQVWLTYTDEQRMVVCSADGSTRNYGIEDTLSGGDLLPGFELVLREVFR